MSNYDAEKLVLQIDELESTIKLVHCMTKNTAILIRFTLYLCRKQAKRVQEAEELSEEAKEQLRLAMERITELEAELADSKKVKERNTSGGKGKKSAVRKASKVPESPVKKKIN